MAREGTSKTTTEVEVGPERRGRLLRVRVQQSDLTRWRAAAERQGVHNLSAWLRALADQAVACGTDPAGWRHDLARMLRDLNAGVGNNLNQIARTLAPGEALDEINGPLGHLADELGLLRRDIRAHLIGRPLPRRRSRAKEAVS